VLAPATEPGGLYTQLMTLRADGSFHSEMTLHCPRCSVMSTVSPGPVSADYERGWFKYICHQCYEEVELTFRNPNHPVVDLEGFRSPSQ
jgi:hypothetical protein